MPDVQRARCRLRPRRARDPGRARRRRVGGERPEGVDDAGPRRRAGGCCSPAPTPRQPKHAGLTYFLIDMHSPGVEVRPLRQLTGEAEFNEIYFTDAAHPRLAALGDVGEGWRVAVATLMNERVARRRAAQGGARGRAHPPRRAPLRTSGADRPAVRDQLMSLWIEAEVLRLTTLRARKRRASRGRPGPRARSSSSPAASSTSACSPSASTCSAPRGCWCRATRCVRPDGDGRGSLGDDGQFDIAKAFLASPGHDDRRGHHRDRPQHRRRAGARAARRAARRQGPPLEPGSAQLNRRLRGSISRRRRPG